MKLRIPNLGRVANADYLQMHWPLRHSQFTTMNAPLFAPEYTSADECIQQSRQIENQSER
jgi:hypothetical protein